MKNFIAYIVKALVDHPEQIRVTEIVGRTNIIIEVRCHPEDMGRIIGKSGKTISAIRMLLARLAAKHKRKAVLEVVE